MGLIDFLGGLVGGGPGGNPNQEFKGYGDQFYNQAQQFFDPNSQWYKTAGDAYSRQLSGQTPTLNSMLGFAMNQGGGYGGSFTIGNQQAKAMEARNREATANFQGNLLQTGTQVGLGLDKLGAGMYDIYGQGNTQAYNARNSFNNQLLTGVGGFLGGGGLKDLWNFGKDAYSTVSGWM